MAVHPGTTVGRSAELEQLDAALDALAAGAGGCVTVEGEPGIGKTRLLGELRRGAEARGLAAVSGAATEFERELPFSVFVDALDAHVGELELDLPPALRSELGGVLPALRIPAGHEPPSVADERYRAHRAMRALLERLASPAPLVLALDDLHWADAASIELIAALLRRGVPGGVLLALGFRAGKAPERLTAALGVPSVRRLVLSPLDERESATLLGAVDARTAAGLHRLAGGNPFYLEQLARAHGDGNGHAADAGAAALSGTVPPAVAASLAAELAEMSAGERALLQAAAVAGEPFEIDLATAVAGLDPAAGLDALDGLLAAELLRPTGVPRRFAFRHPLVRQAAYAAAPAGRRLAAHARAAAILAASGATPAERAHHVEQAAAPGDEDAVAVLLEAAAASAQRAPTTAVRWYGAVLRLLSHDDARQVGVRVELASAHRSLGELEPARAVLLEAIARLPAAGDPLRVELTARCAALEHWLGRHEEAHQRLERAWAGLPDRDGAASAALQLELAVDGLYALDVDRALAMGAGALATARRSGDRPLTCAAAAALSLAEVAAGQVPAAREHREEALGHLGALSDADLAPRLEALYYVGWAENYLERYDDAVAHADRGIAVARATGEGRMLVPMMLVKCYPLELQGRLAEAVELCEAAVEATRLSASTHELFWALCELAFARYYTGELDAAVAAAEESARVGGRLAGGTMPAGGGGPGWPLGMALVAAGEVRRGLDVMRSLGDDDLRHKVPVERCFDWEILALAEIALGRVDAAEALARRSEAHAVRLGLRVPAGLATRTRAAVLLARGDAREAARLARESAVDLAAGGAALQAVYSIGMAGQALAAAGERDAAVAALREAERELDAAGSLRVRDELRRDLRRLGARAEPRGPASGAHAGVASLSVREREIADLVTERLTNREIAAALFLSDKTVESHLRNIFAKLRVSSRVEVARAVERERRA